jgi:hypothetical protein
MWLKMINTINLYDDEETDFFVRTDCSLKDFKEMLDTYRKEEHSQQYGYNYDDFFKIIINRGYFIDVIHKNNADLTLYF